MKLHVEVICFKYLGTENTSGKCFNDDTDNIFMKVAKCRKKPIDKINEVTFIICQFRHVFKKAIFLIQDPSPPDTH